MTLKDSFDKLVPIEFGGMQEPLLSDCEKTADDYAIEFLNWYISKSSIMDKKYIGKTSQQLLEIFKKEKGL
jgi:hypothetical protein